MQEQAHGTHDVQTGDRKRLADRNSDANRRVCADSVCQSRSKNPAPTVTFRSSVKKQIRNEWDICNSWLFCSLMKRMCRSVPSLAPLLSISPRFCLSFYFYVDKSPHGAPLLWLLLHVTGSMMFVGCQLYSVPTVSRGERSCDSSNVHTR